MAQANKTSSQIQIERQNALVDRYRKSRVLIIEDSAEARGMIRGFMRDAGVQDIDLASSGQEGIEYMRARAYDIVLCDYNLGKGKDGQQVLEEARFSDYLSHKTVFMMITAETTVEMVMGALEYQPDNYLSKPFTRNDLTKRLDRAMATKLEYRAIEAAFGANDYAKTIVLCEEKLATPGNHFRALRLKGEALLELQRFEEAITLFRSVLAERDMAWAKIGLGRALYETGELAQAADIFKGLIVEQPNVVESYDWLAKIQQADKEPRLAQDTLEAAVNRSPKAVLRQQALAKLALKNHSYLVAEKAFRKAIILSADSCYHTPDNYLQYVRALLVKIDGTESKLEREAFKEARLFLARLRKEFPKDPKVAFKANMLEALVCHRNRKFGEAEQHRLAGKARLMEFSQRERLALSDEYVGTLSLMNAFDEAEAYVHELQKAVDKPELANRLRRRIVDGRRRQHSDNLNREALELSARGHILEAQAKFSEAAAAKGVSPNLLLNAARMCLELAEREDLNTESWRGECGAYLTRLEDLDTRDHRYEELLQLKERYNKLA